MERTGFVLSIERSPATPHAPHSFGTNSPCIRSEYPAGEFHDQINTDITGTVNRDAYVAWLKLNGYIHPRTKERIETDF